MNEPRAGVSEANVEEAANSIGIACRNVRLPAFVVAATETPVEWLAMPTCQHSNSVVIVLPGALNQDRTGASEARYVRSIWLLYRYVRRRRAAPWSPSWVSQIAVSLLLSS